MSDAQGNGQPVAATNPGDLMEITCERCKEKFFVRMPLIDIVNRVIHSTVVVPHPIAQFCPGCGQGYQYALVSIGQIQSKFIAVDDKATAKIIEPPLGMKLPRM